MPKLQKEKTEYQIAKKAYPASYLNSICRKIGIRGKDKEIFSKRVRHSAERYLVLTRLNSNRLNPTEQKRLLNKYKKSLKEALLTYQKINTDSATSGKLGKAIRETYKGISEPAMKQMFNPYCNDTSIAPTLFENFLFLLVETAEDAKSQDIGNDKSALSGIFITEWITAIAKCWPEGANISFTTGSYYKENKAYKSECVSILQDILRKINPKISRKTVETAIRKIKENKLTNKPVANFFVA